MKNLKKVLSLVLALAMALSLMTVAFAKDASDYADYDKVTNKEAVSVLTTLEVIDGMGGSFNPTGNVTRAQMAKMITIISLGNVDATAFLGTKTDLKDINGHWAEAYIKYCYSQGIISGRGNGIFDPNANVTSAEASKMLLTAIGYNAGVQGYTGAQWAINVTRDAQISGFYKGVSVPANQALTRDEAAQMIYNAVDATLIQKTSSVDRTDGSIVDTYAPYADGRDLLSETFNVVTTLGVLSNMGGNEKGFSVIDRDNGAVKYVATANGGTQSVSIHSASTDNTYAYDLTDLLGKEVKVLTNTKTGKIIGLCDTGVSKVYTTDVASISKDSDKADNIKFGDVSYKLTACSAGAAAVNGSIEVTTDGGHTWNTRTRDYFYSNVLNRTETNAVKFVDVNGDGTLDLAYIAPMAVVKVTFVGPSSITATKQAGNYTPAAAPKLEDIQTYAGIAKDDYAVVTVDPFSGDEVYTKLALTTGKVEGTRSNTTIGAGVNEFQVNGTWYHAAAGVSYVPTLGDTVELAAIGSAYYYGKTTDGANSVKDVVMLVSYNPANNLNGIEAKLMFSDGTSKVVPIDTTAANAYTSYRGSDCGKLYTYEVQNDGDYALFPIASGAMGDYTWDIAAATVDHGTSGTIATIDNQSIADDAVVFVFNKTAASAANGGNMAQVITGKALKALNVGTNNATINATAQQYATSKSNGLVKASILAVYMGAATNDFGTLNGVTSANYAYVTGTPYKTTMDGKEYTAYPVWTGSENTTVYFETNAAVSGAKGDIITYDIKDGDKITNLTVNVATIGAITGLSGTEIQFAGVSGLKKLTSDTVYMYVDSNGSTIGVSGGELALAQEPVTGSYVQNVKYVLNAAGDEVEFICIDVTGEMAGGTTITTASAGIAADATAADVKALPDGAYVPTDSDFAADVAGNAADNRIFKFTGVSTDATTYTLTIKNSAGTTVYTETANFSDTNGHFFYITLNPVQNNKGTESDTWSTQTAAPAGTYTYEVTANSAVILDGAFMV